MTNTENHQSTVRYAMDGKSYRAACTCGWLSHFTWGTTEGARSSGRNHEALHAGNPGDYKAETEKAETHSANLRKVIHRTDSKPAVEAADFQAHLIAAAAKVIDPETWKQMITEATQYAKRDPWTTGGGA